VTIDTVNASTVTGTTTANSSVAIDVDNDGSVDVTVMADGSGNYTADISAFTTTPQPFISAFDIGGFGESTGEFVEFTIPSGVDPSLVIVEFYGETNTPIDINSSFFAGQENVSVQDIIDAVGGVGGTLATSLGGNALDLTVRENENEPGSLVITLPATGGAVGVGAPATDFTTVALTVLANAGDSSGTVVDTLGTLNSTVGTTLSGGLADGAEIARVATGSGGSTIDEFESDGTETQVTGGTGEAQALGLDNSTFSVQDISKS